MDFNFQQIEQTLSPSRDSAQKIGCSIIEAHNISKVSINLAQTGAGRTNCLRFVFACIILSKHNETGLMKRSAASTVKNPRFSGSNVVLDQIPKSQCFAISNRLST